MSNDKVIQALKEHIAPKEIPKEKEKDKDEFPKKGKALSTYTSSRVHQFFKANGFKISAVDNGYTPADDEETTILEHFVSIGFATKN